MDYTNNGRNNNRGRVIVPACSRGGIPSNGIFIYPNNRQDLSLTATGLTVPPSGSSSHSPHSLYPTRDPTSSTSTSHRAGGGGGMRLSQSDSKALQIMMMSKRDKTLHRRSSEDIIPTTPHTTSTKPPQQLAPIPAAMRPPSSRLITALGRPPPSPSPSAAHPPLPSLLLPPIQLDNLYTIEQESVTTEGENERLVEEEDGEGEETGEEDTSDSIIDDSEEDEHLISGVGFRDDTYTSQTALNEVNFSSLTNDDNKGGPLPATLLMEHYLSVHQFRSQGIQPGGYNARVNNIVRAFEIKGPLDKEQLQEALNKVVSLHNVLMATFTVTADSKYYWKTTSQGSVVIDQTISYERPSELITLARRKIFDAHIQQDLTRTCSVANRDGRHDDIDDKLSIVSYKEETSPKVTRQKTSHLLQPLMTQVSTANAKSTLMFAKLITKTPHEHVLILSFSSIVADYWSSCLFVQQLVDAYGKLEKSSSYKPSLSVLRQTQKRTEVFNAIENRRAKAGLSRPPTLPPSSRLAAIQRGNSNRSSSLQLRSSPCAVFEQVCSREQQILVVKPIEKLWNYWESNVTSTIKRLRGPPRVKVIPPLRIPSGFGEIIRATVRPMTSRLRPLTAARQRPPTAKRSTERLVGGESLTGPIIGTVYIKVEEKIGFDIIQYFPEEYLSKIDRKELLGLVTLSAYTLLLGRCCRGWGGGGAKITSTTSTRKEGSGLLSTTQDPLQKYDGGGKSSGVHLSVPNTGLHQSSSHGEKKRGCKLDVGSFLIGVDVSLRQLAPEATQGLLGPLTNTVGLRVDLSSYSSFADMVYSLWTSLHRCRSHGHFPFTTIGDELGLVHGLPVRFSHFNTYDVQQLSNPEAFYFMETSVGVQEQKALARMGSCCYINPLNSKMDDSCQLELLIWEGVKGESIEGLLHFQTKLLRNEVVRAFSQELVTILKTVSIHPLISLSELASNIQPPFVNTGLRERKR